MIVKSLLKNVTEDKRFVISFGVLTALAVGLRVALIAAADTRSIVTYIPDDSFYYFQLAYNFIKGLPSSVDGVHLTNGYHPLWVWNIGPIMLLKDVDPTLAVKAVLLYGSFLSVGTAFVIYFIVREIGVPRWVGLFAYGVYLFTPNIALGDAIGEPSGLSNFLIALTALVLIRVAKGGGFGFRRAAGFGVLLGLLILARTDNLLFASIFYVFVFKWGPGFRPKYLATTAVVAAAIIAPWYIWNLVVFGTFVQVSAVAVPYLNHVHLYDNPNTLQTAYIVLVKSIGGAWVITRFFPGALLLLFLSGALCAVYHRKYEGTHIEKRAVTLSFALFAVVALLYFLHSAGALYIRSWHTASAAPITVIIVALFLSIFKGTSSGNRIFRGVFVALYIVLISAAAVRLSILPPESHLTENLRAVEWVKENPDSVISTYDAGIISYFTDGAVLPVDGNVNIEAHEAIVERRLYDYMVENDVGYFINWSVMLKKYQPFWPYPREDIFTDVTPKDLPLKKAGRAGEFRYYKLDRSYEPPE